MHLLIECKLEYNDIFEKIFFENDEGFINVNQSQIENTILSAWRMATRNRNVEEGLIFHSDREFQYANNKFTNVLNSYEKSQEVFVEKEIVGIMLWQNVSINH